MSVFLHVERKTSIDPDKTSKKYFQVYKHPAGKFALNLSQSTDKAYVKRRSFHAPNLM